MGYRTFRGFLKSNPRIRLFFDQNPHSLPYLVYLSAGGTSDYDDYVSHRNRISDYDNRRMHRNKPVDIRHISRQDKRIIRDLINSVYYCPSDHFGLVFYIDWAIKVNHDWRKSLDSSVKNHILSAHLPYVFYSSSGTFSRCEEVHTRLFFDKHYALLNQCMVQLKLRGDIPSELSYPIRRDRIVEALEKLIDMPPHELSILYDAWDLANNP